MDARNWRSGGGADYYDDDSLLTHSLQLTKQVKYIRKYLAIDGPMIYMAPYVSAFDASRSITRAIGRGLDPHPGHQDFFWACEIASKH